MPALGMNQESGILVAWLKQEGDEIKTGDPLMEVETDKTTVEIESPASGILANVTALPGDSVPVGSVIALILAPGETAPPKIAPVQPAAATTPPPAPASPAPATPPAPPIARPQASASDGTPVASPLAARMAAEHGIPLNQIPARSGRIGKEDVLAYIDQQDANGQSGNGKLIPASPKARRLAQEQGVALAALRGSGPNGAILATDVLTAASQPAAAIVPAGQSLEISNVWRVMAQRLTESWTTVPHFYLVREVDASQLMAWRSIAQDETVEKLTVTDLLVRLVAVALSKHPRVNASWNDGSISLNPDINVGLAVAVDDGLLVPVIHSANHLSLDELALRRKEVVERAQAGRLKLDDLQGGTFTISNLGMYGVDAFNAIVNPPQAAILAVGRIADRVVAINGEPAVRPVMVLSLSFDHRVVDGARGAQFLDTLARLIEEPMRLID